MGETQSQYIPESDEEMRLMSDLHRLVAQAIDDGVEREEVAKILMFGSASVLNHDDEDFEPDAEPSDGTERRNTCPNCAEHIEDVSAYMGGAVVAPCGCSVDVFEVEGWLDV
jgi:hypothetical protein